MPGIDAGLPYSGQVLFDTSDPLLYTFGSQAVYGMTQNDQISINVGGCTISASGSGAGQNQLGVTQDQGLDRFEVWGGAAATTPNCVALSPTHLGLEITGPSGLFSGNAIPAAFDFDNLVQPGYSGYGSDIFVDFPSQMIPGNFSAIQYASVPEPAMVIPFALALCGIVWRRRISSATPSTTYS